MNDKQQRPDWRVTVATDDAKILELTLNRTTGQVYLAGGDPHRALSHIATFNGKTHALANLVDALIEADDQIGTAPGAA